MYIINLSFNSYSRNETSFSEIGGLLEAKNLIIETFKTPIRYSFLYKSLPTKLPKGNYA